MIFLFAALRILAQTPDPTQSATAPELEGAAPAAEVMPPAAAESAPPAAPGETVTSLGRIRFSVKQVDPSYTVVQGDSLSSIAQRNGTTAEAIQGINNLPDTFLSVGQRLVLP